MRNKYGLPRTIPPQVKQEIRQRCGFGCVVCGCGLIEYEHLDPSYSEATEHNPTKITLLCPTCHSNVTRKFWSKDKIIRANAQPFCLQKGNPRAMLDFSGDHPILVFGGMTFHKCRIPIQVYEHPLIKISPPEEKNGPFLLSALFCNSDGKIALEIVNNEWIARTSNWDVQAAGGKITITDHSGKPNLVFSVYPPDKIIIEQLNMQLGKFKFLINNNACEVTGPSGSKISMRDCISYDSEIGMVIYNF